MEIIKVGSGELTNYPYLKKIALKNKEIIISTGMSNLSEIERALLNILLLKGEKNIPESIKVDTVNEIIDKIKA